MASQGLFSIGGIASGLDTTDIIDQLLQLERQPVKRLERQQDDLGKVKEAWGEVNAKLSTLRSATDKITRIDRFDSFMSVTSSNEDAVSVSASGKTDTGSLSFTVEQLARPKQMASTYQFTSRDQAIGDGTLTITDANGVDHAVTADLGPEATLDELVAAINASNAGVRATALQVEGGKYQLVLDAKETGMDGAFSVTAGGAPWADAFMTSQTEQDAVLKVGGVQVTRSTNTITDLVDGATITLRKPTTEAVSVTAARDVDGAVDAVKAFVEGLQGVFSKISELTAYDPETNEAGRLQGETAARRLTSSLRDAISRPIDGQEGVNALASTLGISFSRTGELQFDEAAMRQAFTDDFEGTAGRLARTGSTTDAAGLFLNATSAAQPGTYAVEVTTAAEVATRLGGDYEAGVGGERTLRFARPNGRFADITLNGTDHANVDDAAGYIRDQLAAGGVSGLDVVVEGGALRVSTTAYGSAARFTVTELDGAGNPTGGDAFGLAIGGEAAGVDVAGTIGGQAAVGTGRTLQATAGDPNGVSVRVDGAPAPFDVTWSRGLVGELSTALSRAEGSNGTIARARQSVDSQVKIYQDRIDSFMRRLETREATIRRQFVGMETMLGELNAQGQWLGQQLAGLSGGQQQR